MNNGTGKSAFSEEAIGEAIDAALYSMGCGSSDDCTPSGYYITETRRRLFDLPEVCAQYEREENPVFRCIIKAEIQRMKSALGYVAAKWPEQYDIIPMIYFEGLDFKEAAFQSVRTRQQVKKWHDKLLREITFCLYGVRAWKIWEKRPPFAPFKPGGVP